MEDWQKLQEEACEPAWEQPPAWAPGTNVPVHGGCGHPRPGIDSGELPIQEPRHLSLLHPAENTAPETSWTEPLALCGSTLTF